MPPRHWTILVVPSDNKRPRSFTVSERGRRGILWGAGALATLLLAAIVFLFTPYATPAARLLFAENERLRSQMDGIDGQMLALTDTINAIGQRDREIRALAGIPEDSLASVAGVVSAESRPDDSRRSVAVLPRRQRANRSSTASTLAATR